MRLIIFALAILPAVAFVDGATPKLAAKSAVKRSAAKPAGVQTRSLASARSPVRLAPVAKTVVKSAPKNAAKTPVKTPVKAVAYRASASRYVKTSARFSRFGPRNTRSRYRYVSYFKPVLAVVSADLPEMAPPLENLTARELQDSFYYRRPDGMIHYAIDIFRPIGEPLLAAVDGYVERIDPNPLGGNVVYLVDEEKRFRFYYAHLERHAEGLYAGMPVKRGDVIGYVGDTGNAKGTQPHLHFQIANLAGAVVNPFPLLMDLVRREESLPSE